MRTITIEIRYDNGFKFKHPYLDECEIVSTHISFNTYPDYTVYSNRTLKHYRLSEKAVFYAISAT